MIFPDHCLLLRSYFFQLCYPYLQHGPTEFRNPCLTLGPAFWCLCLRNVSTFFVFIRTSKGGGAGQKQKRSGGKRGAVGGRAGRVTKGGSSGLWMKRHLKVCTVGICFCPSWVPSVYVACFMVLVSHSACVVILLFRSCFYSAFFVFFSSDFFSNRLHAPVVAFLVRFQEKVPLVAHLPVDACVDENNPENIVLALPAIPRPHPHRVWFVFKQKLFE